MIFSPNKIGTFGVHGIHVTVEVRRIFFVNFSHSVGKLEFFVSIRWIKNAKLLSVRGKKKHIMAVGCEETSLLTLGNSDEDDSNAAASQMLYNFVKLIRFLIIEIEFFGNRRAEHAKVRSGRMISYASLGKAYAIFKLKSLFGKIINNHTRAAKSAA